MQLSAASQKVNGVLHGVDCTFTAVCTDTRSLAPGCLFVALKGEHFDAHNYLVQAQAAGVVGAVVERFNAQLNLPQIVVTDTYEALGLLGAAWRQAFTGKVIAVTGSSGKTTVKGFLQSILGGAGLVHATPGNWNNHVGVPLTLFGLGDQDYAVIELGTSSPGEISYLAQLVQPHVALVNNISLAHIEGFGSLDAIAQEKSAIYAPLTEDGISVINGDDQYAPMLSQQTESCRQLKFCQTNKEAPDVYASNIRYTSIGCAQFDLNIAKQVLPVQINVPGSHNVQNALAAAACALAVEVSPENIVAGLEKYSGTPGRMQIKHGFSGATIVDDSYNANPDSVRAAIDFLVLQAGKKILVLGDMGELGEWVNQSHQQVGEYAKAQKLDAIFCVGEKSALAAKAFGTHGKSFATQSGLADALKPILDSNTTALVKGSRSAHMEHVVNALCAEEQAVC